MDYQEENVLLDNEILSKDFISDYNIDSCTLIVKKIIKKYQKLRNSIPEEPSLRISARYEPIYTCPTPKTNTATNKIDKYLDDVAEYQYINSKIKLVMLLMNSEERACFVECFLNNKSENSVAKIIGRSRCGLIPYINSCIIRVVLAFHLEVKKDDNREISLDEELIFEKY